MPAITTLEFSWMYRRDVICKACSLHNIVWFAETLLLRQHLHVILAIKQSQIKRRMKEMHHPSAYLVHQG